MKKNKSFVRACSAVLSISLVSAIAAPALAAPPSPTYDEALYVTLDPYGVAKNSSVVKSYSLNGASSITDHGTYSSVTNMSNHAAPVKTDTGVTFNFDKDAPQRFYFEGTTDQPLAQLPWKIDVSYKLNGVPKKAEDLGGGVGLVEIDIDLEPNTQAPDYFRNNMMLQIAAMVDADKALSLEAEGAQLQSIGNMKAVVFMVLPGEDAHYSIRIGTEDFSFGGLTFLMIPATVSQLEQITDLKDVKDKARTTADAVSESLDVLLNTMNGMQSSLYSAARGLDQLNDARGTFSSGKGTIYNDVDSALKDLTDINNAMRPIDGHITEAQSLLTDTNKHLNELTATANSLHPELESLRKIISDTKKDVENLRDMTGDLQGISSDINRHLGDMNSRVSSLESSLVSLRLALDSLPSDINSAIDSIIENTEVDLHKLDSSVPAGTKLKVKEIKQIIASVAEIETAYRAAVEAQQIDPSQVNFPAFATKVLTEKGVPAEQVPLYLGIYAKKDVIAAKFKEIDDIKGNIASLSPVLSKVTSKTSNVCADLASLMSALDGDGLGGDLKRIAKIISDHDGTLNSLLFQLDEGGDLLTRVSSIADTALTQIDSLVQTLNTYEPLTQQALEDMKTINSAGTAGLNDLNILFSDTRDLAKKTGNQLDPGTKQTLAGTASILRSSATGFAQSGILKRNKNILKGLIDDELDKIEEDSNLLNIDPKARPVSLTSAENPAPQSLQIILRTEEINQDSNDKNTIEKDEEFHPDGSILSRIGSIFRKIKDTVAGLFD